MSSSSTHEGAGREPAFLQALPDAYAARHPGDDPTQVRMHAGNRVETGRASLRLAVDLIRSAPPGPLPEGLLDQMIGAASEFWSAVLFQRGLPRP